MPSIFDWWFLTSEAMNENQNFIYLKIIKSPIKNGKNKKNSKYKKREKI